MVEECLGRRMYVFPVPVSSLAPVQLVVAKGTISVDNTVPPNRIVECNFRWNTKGPVGSSASIEKRSPDTSNGGGANVDWDRERQTTTSRSGPNGEDAKLQDLSKTSVVFVCVSFIILMAISLAWLVFYYVQRFRYAHAKDRLAVSPKRSHANSVPNRPRFNFRGVCSTRQRRPCPRCRQRR